MHMHCDGARNVLWNYMGGDYGNGSAGRHLLESVRGRAPELWFAAFGVSMPPALTLPLTCNAASRKPRAD
eukprot:scaffold84740_cov75-Phaeocystis_antarctica.AAC.2